MTSLDTDVDDALARVAIAAHSDLTQASHVITEPLMTVPLSAPIALAASASDEKPTAPVPEPFLGKTSAHLASPTVFACASNSLKVQESGRLPIQMVLEGTTLPFFPLPLPLPLPLPPLPQDLPWNVFRGC